MKNLERLEKLEKNTPEANKTIMMTLLKIATVYYKNDKEMYVAKWNDFFVECFPNCTFVFNPKEGKRVPAVGEALNYLVENGFGAVTQVKGKTYKLFGLIKTGIDKINNALDKDNMNEVEENAMYTAIETFYAKAETGKNQSSKISFDEMFN